MRNILVWASLSAALALASGACEAVDPGPGDGPDAGGEEGAFTAIYNSQSFQLCKGCHAPGAAGFVEGETETTQDWSTRDSAYSSLQGMASGMMGNFEGCNGVPFLGATPEDSLLVAVFDEDVRGEFMLADHMNCDVDAISDMTLKIGGPLPGALLDDLKQWIRDGALDE